MKAPMTIAIASTKPDLRAAIRTARAAGKIIGLVPTMGALHEGHASLVRAARAATGFVVVTVFVNPTQFGPHEDLDRYPRTFDGDLEVCARAGADLVFHPDAAEMYPADMRTFVEVEQLPDGLCGASRPGHFRGVCTVVAKLFNLVQPDVAFFGQKDAQQARIIRQMARDLDFPVEVRVCPTVREVDGLALSSRNRLLAPAHRAQAPVLYRALRKAEQLVAGGERDAATVEQAIRGHLATAPDGVVDYVALVDADTLRPVVRIAGPLLIALAVKFGNTRLIDNVIVQATGDA
jgi:pantoate--beta-alanine ligase